CSCSAILLRVQRLHISSDSAGTMKFFLSSRQHHSFSLSGIASRSSHGLEAFQSLKLIGMWSLTIHPDCLMNSFGGSFWSDRFAIWTNFRYNEPPFQFFC